MVFLCDGQLLHSEPTGSHYISRIRHDVYDTWYKRNGTNAEIGEVSGVKVSPYERQCKLGSLIYGVTVRLGLKEMWKAERPTDGLAGRNEK